MALNLIKRLSSGTAPYFSLAALLLVLAYLMSAATEDSSRLNDLFLIIFGLGVLCLILLTAILIRSLLRLYRDFKREEVGSRLTVRLVSLFVLLILVSTTIVYSFSVHFLHRGINSWFDVNVEQALDDALDLSRSAFGIRMRTLLRQTKMMSGVLRDLPEGDLNHSLRELNQLSGALELSVWSIDGQLITASIENPAIMVPAKPNEAIFRQLQQQQDYISLDPGDNGELQLRAAVLMQKKLPSHPEDLVLQVLFPVNERLSSLGKTVQDAYTDYKELSYLRKPLITIFTLTLSLIVLLTVLTSIWFAVWISRRIVQPLQELADGTQSVASGNYNTQITVAGHDEIGFLVRSFNQMTQRLTQSRNATQRSHRLLEQQTNYLGAVLGSLSSGVITLDDKQFLKTANVVSSTILDINLQHRLESPLNKLAENQGHLQDFIQMIFVNIQQHSSWQQQLDLYPGKRHQTLMCRGTPLPSESGWVIVFDDITTLIQAQRSAAWGEVARRLAHEIKNPLTPIQLSAERLQHKYLPLLPEGQTEPLNKLTNTIIQQVDALKEMVNDFSDYARNPELQLSNCIISDLINNVLALYQSNSKHEISLLDGSPSLTVKLDSNRFRQVLHNLIKNAIEASEEAGLSVVVELSYDAIQYNHNKWLELKVRDHGPGIPENMISKLFEPYATNKTKGTGLGLAIVKKIIEEHQGIVWAENIHPDGACIMIRLPLEDSTP
ncbi:MAG: ATP-binding protein [Gammaproteobacteria bacterium]|nr:ATP-binding protein [Gammaproteobacteria bacterium]MDH5592248.1 ATP-binding protein [Gammaproteobacteria bacterium]